MAALDAKGVRAKTAIFITSDHGFSTINRKVDIHATLQAAGFHAPKEFKQSSQTGEIMVVGLGGSALAISVVAEGGRHRLLR